MHNSAFNILRQGLAGNRGWPRAWRNQRPQKRYDAVIVGGGHGLATAYYLAHRHGLRNVAVLERGHVGGGNIGRNTTVIRSNYLLPPNTQFYEHSMQLWEGLSRELNYNVMFSQRGQIITAHSEDQLDGFAHRANVMRANGIEAEILNQDELRRMLPYLDWSDQQRFPLYGAIMQRRAGTARHDAVAWGYARAADRLGVDIIENCEVTGISMASGRVTGVETTQGEIVSRSVGLTVAGHTTQLCHMAGITDPAN